MKSENRLIHSFFILTLMQGMVLGCQSHSTKPSETYPNQSQQPSPVEDNPVQPMQIVPRGLMHAEVSCEGKACPESIGLVQIGFENNIHQCTGFLTGKDILVINSHCLPDSWQDGDSCEGKLDVTFPKVGKLPVETVKCKQIIKRTNNRPNKDGFYDSHLDLVFIILSKKLHRGSYIIDPSPIPDGSVVMVFKVNPEYGKGMTKGSIELAYYTVKTGNPGMANPYLTLTALNAETKILQGNSGSPVVDDNGNVRGILQGPQVIDKKATRIGVAKTVPCIPDLTTCLK